MPPTVMSGFGTPVAALPSLEPLPAARMTVCETDSEEGIRCILPYGPYGASRRVHVTFPGLAHISDPARLGAAPGGSAAPSPDRFERDTIEILKRLSRRTVDPSPESELMADLGF